ncbi:hypothetical protein ABT336_20340 [Micromonospora sp. NPDC000207]|uniref:hypothetical protein n=1 Tax=Micromonospora sp. NPDC000207 TaxID=3154246 RepID=UPI00332B7C90
MAKDELFAEIVLDVGGEVYTRTVDRFVQETEAFRGHYLSGEGPVFALYETVQSMLDTAEREGRRLTPTEETLIRGIRRKTFVMFEEELQRAGSPGADPDPPRP